METCPDLKQVPSTWNPGCPIPPCQILASISSLEKFCKCSGYKELCFCYEEEGEAQYHHHHVKSLQKTTAQALWLQSRRQGSRPRPRSQASPHDRPTDVTREPCLLQSKVWFFTWSIRCLPSKPSWTYVYLLLVELLHGLFGDDLSIICFLG